MAVDTANRRFSMLAFGKIVPQVFPVPDASIDQEDRAQYVYIYPGISISTVPVSPAGDQFFRRRRGFG